MRALAVIDSWPVGRAAAAALTPHGIATHGDTGRAYAIASLTKVAVAWASLVAVEEGTIGLDDPVGQPGCTLRHLLAHAGGYPFEGATPIAPPGQRRIYSNTGIELATGAVAGATGIAFGDYLREAVLDPLGMGATHLAGSSAHGLVSTVEDLARFLAELAAPTLVAPATALQARSIQFPDLAGIVPGIGRFSPCPWSLGAEVRGEKRPHWTGRTNSASTFGHFGGSGTFMWMDPVHRVGLVALTDRPFDDWAADALKAWPALADGVLAEAAGR